MLHKSIVADYYLSWRPAHTFVEILTAGGSGLDSQQCSRPFISFPGNGSGKAA